MANSGAHAFPKIGRHVTYVGANRKPRPGTITAVAGNVLTIRIRRHGEVYTSVSKKNAKTDTAVWKSI